MQTDEGMNRLSEHREALLKGDEAAVAAQKKLGRLTARERVSRLLDPGSLIELDAYAAEGNALCGWGLVNSRPVYILAQDATSGEGAMNARQAAKMVKALDMAYKAEAPVILMPDSHGMQVSEGAKALAAYAQVFSELAGIGGVCPLIAILAGEAVGSATHFAALSDIVIAVDKLCQVSPFPASVLNAVHGKALDAEQLSGAQTLAGKGAAALTASSEEEAFRLARKLLDLLPSSAHDNAPFEEGDDLNRLVAYPPSGAKALALDVMDKGSAVELFAGWRDTCGTWLGRVGGYACGMVSVVGEQNGGRLDGLACDKIARFVAFCDDFDLPVITLVDSEGLEVPSIDSQAWLMTASARLLTTYAESNTPRLALITGKAVGASYVAFAGKAIADVTLAWPGAYIAPLSPEAAVQTFDAARLASESRGELEAREALSADAFSAARDGLVDDVIDPAESRKHLIMALELLAGGRRA